TDAVGHRPTVRSVNLKRPGPPNVPRLEHAAGDRPAIRNEVASRRAGIDVGGPRKLVILTHDSAAGVDLPPRPRREVKLRLGSHLTKDSPDLAPEETVRALVRHRERGSKVVERGDPLLRRA